MSQEILFRVYANDRQNNRVSELIVVASSKNEAEVRACSFFSKSRTDLSSAAIPSIQILSVQPLGNNNCVVVRRISFSAYIQNKNRSLSHVKRNIEINRKIAKTFSESLTPEERKMTQSQYQATVLKKEDEVRKARQKRQKIARKAAKNRKPGGGTFILSGGAVESNRRKY